MKTILNIPWLVLAGVWLAISYAIAAVLLTITIGIPFAKQALKLGRRARSPSASSPLILEERVV